MRRRHLSLLLTLGVLASVVAAACVSGASVAGTTTSSQTAIQAAEIAGAQAVEAATSTPAEPAQGATSTTAGAGPVAQAPGASPAPGASQPPPPPGGGQGGTGGGNPPATGSGPGYTIEQAISDKAQSTTIAFDALGFLTGSLSSDSFFPPGKVADFWGFQYLRDNDPTEMGHNTDFLTSASLNMLATLTTAQRASLIALAKSQVASINDYGYKRFVLMSAFRRLLAGDLPTGTTGLSESAVKAFSAELYALDGKISLERAQVMGPMLASLTSTQRASLDAMKGTGMSTWPTAQETDDLRGLSRDEKVAVMTYAGDMFSWYVGSVEADTYFCPERHGTYFGSFYLKDAPAVGNPGYSIGTTITADLGATLLSKLDATQAASISGLVESQRTALAQIVETRRAVSTELRKLQSGATIDTAAVAALMKTYGELDGSIVYQYATAFAAVGKTLTDAERADLMTMRTTLLGDLAEPTSAFLFSQPIAMPTIPSTDFLFGTGATGGSGGSGGSGAVAPTSAALRVTAGSATGTATKVQNGSSVTITARVVPASAGTTVRLYQRIGKTGAWTSVATGSTGASGVATWSRVVSVPTAAEGYGRYVYFKASAATTSGSAVRWSNAVRVVAAPGAAISSGATGGSPAATPTSSAAPAMGSFAVSSPVVTAGGTLPVAYTCDGAAESPPLAWSGAPAGTVSFAVVMHTQPPDGDAHWYWVLYDIASGVDHLDANAAPPATVGTNSVNGRNEYAPPCSQGPGPKTYTFTVYALSARPDLTDATKVSRPVLLAALEGHVLAQATMDVTYSRAGTDGAGSPPPPAQASPQP